MTNACIQSIKNKTLWKEVFLVLWRKKCIARRAPMDPPKSEKSQRVFSGVRRKFPVDLYLSRPKIKKVIIFRRTKYTNKICSCKGNSKNERSIKNYTSIFVSVRMFPDRCFSRSEKSIRFARILFGRGTFSKIIF